MSLSKLSFYIAKWAKSKPEIINIRKKVFMDEDNLPLNFLRHRDDEERYHVIALNEVTDKPIGTGCIHKDGHIGRIAILPAWRETNSVAHVIVDYLIHIAKSLKQERVWLNAPMKNLDFFSYRDFFPMGTEFEYCGVNMQKIELWREAEEHSIIQKGLYQKRLQKLAEDSTSLPYTDLSFPT